MELALKRQRLQLTAAAQRRELQKSAAALVPAIEFIDKLRAGVEYIKQRPHWVVLGVAVIVVIRPRRAFRWLKRGFIAWQVYRRWRRRVMALPPLQVQS